MSTLMPAHKFYIIRQGRRKWNSCAMREKLNGSRKLVLLEKKRSYKLPGALPK